jgi:hypothetical protein
MPAYACYTKPREKVAPFHSMTSSARTSTELGTVIPSVFAVLRLITSSNLVGCSTGKSPGFAPLDWSFHPGCFGHPAITHKRGLPHAPSHATHGATFMVFCEVVLALSRRRR